jgi:hypothetical protein
MYIFNLILRSVRACYQYLPMYFQLRSLVYDSFIIAELHYRCNAGYSFVSYSVISFMKMFIFSLNLV